MHNDTIRTETTLYYDRCMTSTDDKVIIFQRIGSQKKKIVSIRNNFSEGLSLVLINYW